MEGNGCATSGMGGGEGRGGPLCMKNKVWSSNDGVTPNRAMKLLVWLYFESKAACCLLPGVRIHGFRRTASNSNFKPCQVGGPPKFDRCS
jgi:hypothetical protein